jgi:hypothetical protein
MSSRRECAREGNAPAAGGCCAAFSPLADSARRAVVIVVIDVIRDEVHRRPWR